MHLADLASYTVTQSRVSELYANRAEWGQPAQRRNAERYRKDEQVGDG